MIITHPCPQTRYYVIDIMPFVYTCVRVVVFVAITIGRAVGVYVRHHSQPDRIGEIDAIITADDDGWEHAYQDGQGIINFMFAGWKFSSIEPTIWTKKVKMGTWTALIRSSVIDLGCFLGYNESVCGPLTLYCCRVSDSASAKSLSSESTFSIMSSGSLSTGSLDNGCCCCCC